MPSNELTNAKCFDDERRAAVLGHPTLNGIDFVEYYENTALPLPSFWLVVTFLKKLEPKGLVDHPELFQITGGTRVVGIQCTKVENGVQNNQLKVYLSASGDFSTYSLSVKSTELDSQLNSAPINFKATCPTEFDCRPSVECPPELLNEPLLDYFAKDYSSFRRLLLDLIPQRNPGWLERNPADLGMALVELLAYAGDHLSYFQDSVATEAYLDTCRQRVSAKRHARLIDYAMHEGRNAWTYVQFDVRGDGTVPRGTQLLTRVERALRGQAAPPATQVAAALLNYDGDTALREVTVFETAAALNANVLNNEMRIHAWGNGECCLPRGATGAYLYAVQTGTQQAVLPQLSPGDFLVLEEVLGSTTGLPADANPAHRQVVQLVKVQATTDPVFRDQLLNGRLQPLTCLTQHALPLAQVTWRMNDALTFPLCLTTEHPDTGLLENISLARGNVIPCDHGRTHNEAIPLPAILPGAASGVFECRLPRGPLTFQSPAVSNGPSAFLNRDRLDLRGSPRSVAPAVELQLTFPPAEIETWTPAPDLLGDHPFDRHFVVDMDSDGRAVLRFGDGEYGRQPVGALQASARYRTGNGRSGNLGGGALVHVVIPAVAPTWPVVNTLRQPLPARDGVDAETIEEVRQFAPAAFQAEQFRAVTEADYEAAARKLPSVAVAKCTFRWTGSWQTVFVAIHPSNPTDLITFPGGRTRLTDTLHQSVCHQLTRYKLAGYDLEIRTAQYVPLEIALQICVGRGHFRGDVLEAVARALSNQRFADGTVGFFHPSRFGFGQDVYLSQLYTAVEHVEGVDSAVVTVFKRYWAVANNELENGVLLLGDDEIARLDNDPNFAENGVLRLTATGGL